MRHMFLFETILFYKGAPSYYKVHLEDSGYFFEAIPIEYYKHISFPSFSVAQTEQGYNAPTCDNGELVEQAIEDIQKFSYLHKVPASA